MICSLPLADLCGPISPPAPAGINLEYDSRFQELLRISQGTREQQYGKTIIAAKPPDWNLMRQLCNDLVQETRDLRLGVLLVETSTHFDGLEGCAQAMDMLRAWVCDLWADVHPQLDAEDQFDPFERINSLARLSDDANLPRQILGIPLADVGPHHCVTLADIDTVRNVSAVLQGGAPRMSAAEIEAAFLTVELSELRRSYDCVQSIQHSLNGIIQFLDRQSSVGVWNANSLRRRLKDAHEVLKHHLRNRLSAADSVMAEITFKTPTKESTADPVSWVGTTSYSEEACGIGSAIQSRQQAADSMEEIIEFFERHEPSSPVPLLLKRAKRLINQGFVDILRDVAPNGLSQVQSLTGVSDD